MWNGRNEHGNASFYQKLCINSARQWSLNLWQTIKKLYIVSFNYNTHSIVFEGGDQTFPNILVLSIFNKVSFPFRVKRTKFKVMNKIKLQKIYIKSWRWHHNVQSWSILLNPPTLISILTVKFASTYQYL